MCICEEAQTKMAEVIYLQGHEDLAAIAARLQGARNGHITLVIPKDCPSLESPGKMRLLRRTADRLGKEVEIATASRHLRSLARQEGLRASRIGRRVSADAASRARAFPHRGPRLLGRASAASKGLWGLGLFLALGLFSLLVALLVLPSATVQVAPLSERIEVREQFAADPELEALALSSSGIPARFLEVATIGSGRMSTTAQKDMPDAKAKGKVVLLNKGQTAAAIPKDTIVSTSAGTRVRFRTLEGVELPAGRGSRAEVAIEALAAGPSGNVAKDTINTVEGAASLQAAVTNPQPTSGGTVKMVNFVTLEDKKNLHDSLLARLRQEATSRLREGIREGEMLVPDSILVEMMSEAYDRQVNEEASLLNLDMRVQGLALAISRKDLERMLLTRLGTRLREGYQLLSPSLAWEIAGTSPGERKSLLLTVQAQALALATIEESRVKDLIAGRDLTSAKRTLSRELLLREEPSIQLKSSRLGRLPWLSFRIRVLLLMPEA